MKAIANQQKTALWYGILGCLCFGGGDWLMIYGDPSYRGALSWLTAGAAQIPQWRYNLAMILAFPGIILYGVALFAVQGYIKGERERKIYHYLNAFGLTPWIALHLFYVMILTLYSWMNANGYAAEALHVCEGLFAQLSWLVPLTTPTDKSVGFRYQEPTIARTKRALAVSCFPGTTLLLGNRRSHSREPGGSLTLDKLID